MATATHVPCRTCVGCRRVRHQVELVRVVLDAGGQPHVGAGEGRGAWLCGSECLDAAIRRNGFARAWRRPIDAETASRVVEVVTRAMEDRTHPGTLSGGLTNERRLTTTKG